MSVAKKRKRIFDFNLLKKVFRFAAPYKKKLYLSIFLSIVLAVISPLRPFLIQYTVNNFIKDRNTYWLILITIIQIGMLLFETGLRFYFTFLTSWLGQSVVKDLRVTVYKKVLGLNLSQFDKTPIGTLTTRTINDIESINDIFSDGLIPIVADLLSIISILCFMFYADWRLALISLAPFPVLILATYFFKEGVNRSFIAVRNAVAHLNAFVQEHITGMAVVQAFAVEDKEFEKFKKINKEHRNANISAILAYSVFFPVVEIVLAFSIGLLVWWGANNSFNAGVIISFIMYLNLLFRPLRVIADKFNVLQMGMVASERVFKVLENDDFIPISETEIISHKKLKGKVDFDKVWFAYNDEQYVLKDISFAIQPGETLAIVGHTGSGKTSIISLLNRLYHIQKGKIKIDDTDIDQYNLEYLRSNIAVVLQDVFLFSGSINDNVTLRNNKIKKEEVIEAAKLIGVHNFIMKLPNNYEYNVMERGATLSLGQRQLLSFIRALLYNPSILILDEATSSIDTESEILIQHAIDKLIYGRTSIVIAHRLSTIRKANKILVLDKGEIKEIGTHNELLAKQGFYYQLHRMQFEKKEELV
ncbi:MAG: ABC transporter ATP-binding protein/permease [Bacteroidota bacterium]|nr:ABC transporter ATP-binding protein/permease [Bacteroidota bacterium]